MRHRLRILAALTVVGIAAGTAWFAELAELRGSPARLDGAAARTSPSPIEATAKRRAPTEAAPSACRFLAGGVYTCPALVPRGGAMGRCGVAAVAGASEVMRGLLDVDAKALEGGAVLTGIEVVDTREVELSAAPTPAFALGEFELEIRSASTGPTVVVTSPRVIETRPDVSGRRMLIGGQRLADGRRTLLAARCYWGAAVPGG